ncbi:MAG: exodeoxyribonuclease beta subunit [Marmoricola sp.]|nr:exodeoxyribonuclease beta subunit [Marmoricola sp.]
MNPGEDMEPFDLLGELPDGTTLLEASAGTGKTYAVGALVTRYVAEGTARLDQMLVITFGRAASQELRERVREQLVEAERALADPDEARRSGGLVGTLAEVDDIEVSARRKRLRDALADFDAATIATTHQFCQMVLRSLGVAGDTDSGAELVESLDDLVVEVVDDVYLQRFGQAAGEPPFKRAVALELAKAAVRDPQAALAPADADPGSAAHERYTFAKTVRDEVDRRKRRLGVLSYDDLLSRLATALEVPDSPACQRMRQRWTIVLVDEFQDTDPVQWQVLDRAFSGHATMVLIGDPKQAIYAFRGGDIFTYLQAAETAATRRTLAVNWRSDQPLVDALQALLGGAALGDPRIAVHPVEAKHPGSRLQGAPDPAPVRVRVLRGADFAAGDKGTVPIDTVRTHIAQDLANDVARLLASGATFEGRPVGAGDVAVLIYSLKHVGLFQAALSARGIPSVVSGGSSVLLTEAGEDWLALLEALEQPHRSTRVRSVALTPFIGLTAERLDAGGDELTDETAERVRRWLDMLRSRGIAAVHEAIVADGLAARVLARPDGERLLTDLTQLGQVLHEVSHRERLGLPGLLEWLRTERRAAVTSNERTRRLDTDARAVQFVTIHASKGLQYPVVHLPLAFDKWSPEETSPLFHDDDGRRTLDVSGLGDSSANAATARHEACGEELRLTYVALTRAQSQVVAWWAPTWNAGNAGLTRLLLGRAPGESAVPDSAPRGPSDFEVAAALGEWQGHGALAVEISELRAASAPPSRGHAPGLAVRRFDRDVDTEWRRTSYSGLIRAEEQSSTAPGVDSEPEVEGTVDEAGDGDDGSVEAVGPPGSESVAGAPSSTTVGGVGGAEGHDGPADLPSPMNDLPAGATFGSLVHGVLEHADPQAPDLVAELTRRVEEQRRWWSVEASTEALVEGLVPMQHSSLGSLADDLTLAEIGLGDRLRELDFEFPLAGGERPTAEVPLAAMADVLRRHLDAGDPMRAYADRLESPSLGGQALRGYLSGSIDVVLRVGDDPRFVVVDYKTNRLGELGEPVTALDYTPRLMTEAMLHSHYPLQAMLYSVVLHRYLRWRLLGYDPERHLGGILYLYVRGMCGPDTPTVDGQPCGVFAWHPPAAMVLELSDVLDGRVAAGEVAS